MTEHLFHNERERESRTRLLEKRLNDLETRLDILFPHSKGFTAHYDSPCLICHQHWLSKTVDRTVSQVFLPESGTFDYPTQLACKCSNICPSCIQSCKVCDTVICDNHFSDEWEMCLSCQKEVDLQ